VDLRKIPGETNPADLFTKHLASRERLAALIKLLGCEYRSGRAQAAPLTRTIDTGKATIGEAHLLEDAPDMPHLRLAQNDLDARYPSLVAPDDVDSETEGVQDSWDMLQRRGDEIIELIRSRAETVGRKRCEA